MAEQDPTAGMGPGAMIGGIGDLVDTAVNTITGKVDGVRVWSNQDPCSRQAFLYEHQGTVWPMLRRLEGAIAWLQNLGENAVAAAIANRGRPNPNYEGSRRLAAMIADDALPQIPAVALHTVLGGPIGAGAAREAWLDWIDSHMVTGRPSGSRGSPAQKFPPVIMTGQTDAYLVNGRLRGPTIRAVYDAWLVFERAQVDPPWHRDWRGKVSRATAKLSELRVKSEMLQAEIDRYETRCVALRGTQEGRIDALLAEQLAAAAALRGDTRIRAWLPWGGVAVGLFWIARRR